MSEFSIRDKCKINTNRNADTFVGVTCQNGDISVHFPLGYRVSDDDKNLRKDIILLISTIESTIGHRKSGILNNAEYYNHTGLPIQAYLSVIYDYYMRGYYREREIEYNVSERGKINWNRTIKTQKPVIQDNEVYYLDFVTRKNIINETELITLIHELCVYESFGKIGWLFTWAMPEKPRIKRNEKMFLSVLKEKLSRTFNDKNKALFQNMILIIQNLQNNGASFNYEYGTYRFEYVWEKLIDRVYGIEDKKAYFPKTAWKVQGNLHNNAVLEPDSIMLMDDKIYVLDSKYYRYGATGNLADLPESASISKQITYGEYVENNIAKGRKVYNAFIMPFDSEYWNSEVIHSVGEATADWRDNTKIYEHIQAILIDIKYLMQITVRGDRGEIGKLAECIEKSAEGE